jgi:hypothetical protein
MEVHLLDAEYLKTFIGHDQLNVVVVVVHSFVLD